MFKGSVGVSVILVTINPFQGRLDALMMTVVKYFVIDIIILFSTI